MSANSVSASSGGMMRADSIEYVAETWRNELSVCHRRLASEYARRSSFWRQHFAIGVEVRDVEDLVVADALVGVGIAVAAALDRPHLELAEELREGHLLLVVDELLRQHADAAAVHRRHELAGFRCAHGAAQIEPRHLGGKVRMKRFDRERHGGLRLLPNPTAQGSAQQGSLTMQRSARTLRRHAG